MNRTAWVLAGAAVLIAATATGSAVVKSRATKATAATPAAPPNTATVQKGRLSTMVSLDGTLTYRARSDGLPYTVINHKLVQGPTSAEVATTRAAVDAASRQLGDAKSTLSAAETLAARDGAAAQQSAANARQALADANANVAVVQAQVDAGTSSDQVAVANARQALADAEGALAGAQKTFQVLPAVTKEQVATAKNTLWSQQLNRDAICGRGTGGPCDAAKAAVAAAETAVNQVNAQAVQQSQQGQALVDQAQTQVNQAQASLKAAESALESSRAKLQGSQTAAQTQANAAQSALKNAEAALASTQAKGEQAVVAARAQVNTAVSAQQTARASAHAGTYTELPDEGDKFECGDVLYRVDDQPVLLLCGTIPAYRDLRQGDVGNDVRQLNQNLRALGYDASIDPDDNRFTGNTEKALAALQKDKGIDVTGELEIGATIFLPESVRIARVIGELGGSASLGAQVLSATSDRPEVQVDLHASQLGEVKEGDRAQITLPGNKLATGKVDRLGRVTQSRGRLEADIHQVRRGSVPVRRQGGREGRRRGQADRRRPLQG